MKLKLLRKVSKKHAKVITKYLKNRKIYLSKPENQLCKIDTVGCTRKATDVHHSAKKQTEKAWLDESKWIPACDNCHRKAEASPDLCRELGIYNYKA